MGLKSFFQKIGAWLDEREQRRSDRLSREVERLSAERKLLEEKNKIYLAHAEESKHVADLKRSIRLEKVKSVPFGRAGLAMAKRLKDDFNDPSNKRERMSFLPDGKDHPMWRK